VARLDRAKAQFYQRYESFFRQAAGRFSSQFTSLARAG
jgi:hypothetical protein